MCVCVCVCVTSAVTIKRNRSCSSVICSIIVYTVTFSVQPVAASDLNTTNEMHILHTQKTAVLFDQLHVLLINSDNNCHFSSTHSHPAGSVCECKFFSGLSCFPCSSTDSPLPNIYAIIAVCVRGGNTFLTATCI